MTPELAEHILKALDDVAVVGLEGQQDNLNAAAIMRRIRDGELMVVEREHPDAD